MKDNGFTLIELLAVIVILAIILVIAVPQILGVIRDSTKGAMESDAKLLVGALNQRKVLSSEFNPTFYNGKLQELVRDLGIKADNYEDIALVERNGKIFITVTGKEKYDGLVACGSYGEMNVYENECEIDFVPPVITLNDDSTIEIYRDEDYVEPGATALDNIDGSVSTTTSGTVDTSSTGTYTITYTAEDTNGNQVVITREVVVLPPEFDSIKGVNRPKLVSGMTPIKWNGGSWVDTTVNDSDWYNYTIGDKKWANARTQDGSMWVWIPRYGYQIETNYHTATAGTINIKFLRNKSEKAADNSFVALSPTYSGSGQTNYVLQPAFIFGSEELTGIWVAKFDASSVEGNSSTSSACNALDDVSTKTVKIVQNVTIWRCISPNNAFLAALNMKSKSAYGWNSSEIDTHMMKNLEWGAIAYLSRSSYGKVNEIWTNTSVTTGCAGSDSTATSGPTPGGCINAFQTNNGQQASTTGNVYGIYDTVGGSKEMTSAYINGPYASALTNIVSANIKYSDVYTMGNPDNAASNYAANSNKFGDAVYETSSRGDVNTNSWFGDISFMPNNSDSYVFTRGGSYNTASPFYGIFAFEFLNVADINVRNGFRPVVTIN